MATVTVTFVRSTYVMATFVNISNISAFTDPMSQVYKVHIYYTQGGIRVHTNTFWTKKFFLTQNFNLPMILIFLNLRFKQGKSKFKARLRDKDKARSM